LAPQPLCGEESMANINDSNNLQPISSTSH
jgi:hypothetical protein